MSKAKKKSVTKKIIIVDDGEQQSVKAEGIVSKAELIGLLEWSKLAVFEDKIFKRLEKAKSVEPR